MPRHLRLPLAALCRRAGLIRLGLKLLSPLIGTGSRGVIGKAAPKELAEYAALLERKGAVKEALYILSEVDVRRAPEALLYRAFCHFALWEPGAAAACLESYLRMPIDPYLAFMGRVHLTSALIAMEKHAEAQAMLEENIATAKAQGYTRLLLHCYHLRIQSFVANQDWERARADLDMALPVLLDNDAYDRMPFEKWQAVVTAFERKRIEPLLQFRNHALQRRSWENVREADLFTLKLKFDRASADHLLFGTPFEAYRERVRRELNQGPSREYFVFGSENGALVDVFSAHVSGVRTAPTAKVRELFCVLLRDFYRPYGVGGLFAGLFPGESFNIFSSPHRVHQIVYRARAWLEENGLPAGIEVTQGKFRLRVTGECGFSVPYEPRPLSRLDSALLDLHRHFGGQDSFTATQARRALSLPLTSFNRLINELVSRKHVFRLGAGRHTRYCLGLASSSLKAA